ncbi:MAG TPA: TonB-dependent receptor [Opitutaceae bacterium]|nr:TonB-dependent receptor [Opitutaceae bacterium]
MKPHHFIHRLACAGLAGCCLLTRGIIAQETPRELAELSLEELMDEPVMSVGRKETPLIESPAAIAVVTAQDIQRLGLTTLPEALRLVPGMGVGRIRSHQWAVTARGFNNQYVGKLLVMMDGRTLYTPSFGGVHWEVQDTLLEDLDRIEVIRGPGATLWGANAVNGVINATTKDTAETQGSLISLVAGTEEGFGGAVRHGGALGARAHFRVYAKAQDHDDLVDADGDATNDEWRRAQAGFRTDWRPDDARHVTFQGDAYEVRTREHVLLPSFAPPFAVVQDARNKSRGGNLLARWTHRSSDSAHISLQAFYDRYRHQSSLQAETRDTADLDFDQRLPLGDRHDFVWGLGYRYSRDHLPSSPLSSWAPERRTLHLLTGFVQDEITLADRLRVMIGTKLEHNDYTGVEVQPSIRALWLPREGRSVWLAVSRAVSTPPRYAQEAFINLAPVPVGPSLLAYPQVQPNPDARSEVLLAFEAGFRAELDQASVDVALFHHEHRDSIERLNLAPEFRLAPIPHVFLPLLLLNEGTGESSGAEVLLRWRPDDRWDLRATYAYFAMNWPADAAFKADPRHQAAVEARFKASERIELLTRLAYVGGFDVPYGARNVHIPQYLAVDIGLAWRPSEALEVGVWGRNLADPRHPEFATYNTATLAEVPRSFSVRLLWRH